MPLEETSRLKNWFTSFSVAEITFGAKICWSWRHLEVVLKTSSRHVLKTSSISLQRKNFSSSKPSWRRLAKTSWKRLENVLKTSRKASWKTKNCYPEDILKTSWRQTKCLLGMSVSNKSKYKSIFHKSISDKPKANPRCIN